MPIRLKHWSFNPGLWPSVMVVLLMPLLAALGFWQLDRAEQKRSRHEMFLSRQQLDPVQLGAYEPLHASAQDMLWRRVSATGVFNEQIQILLDNQVRHSQAGYFVFTPFQMSGMNTYVLVNRGWVPAGLDRNRIPELERINQEASILATVKYAQSSGIVLQDLPAEKLGPGVYRVHTLKPAGLSETLAMNFPDVVLRLEPGSDHGYLLDWPQPGSDEAMHRGYAFQWFALAVALLLIYLWVNTRRIKH
ncbi:MAG: SURF1 family protein [Thiotrichales bacterium]|nr:SURF1 family protein [Thiotrichales bacterium]